MTSKGAASTRIGNFRTFSISRGLDSEPNSTDGNLLRLVGTNKRVLELGCGSGHMSSVLRERGCNIIGVEIDPQAAQAAGRTCERVILGDLDYINFDREIGNDRFDVVLLADVLEHLKDPLSVLRSVKRFLLPGGSIVISVPNVAHVSVRLALLAGQFPYGETGLLDQTHLRFLTRDSLEKLLRDAGLAIDQLERIMKTPTDPAHFEVPFDPAILPDSIREELYRDPEALTYQFVLSAYSGTDFQQPEAAASLRVPADSLEEDSLGTVIEERNRLRHEVARLQELCFRSQPNVDYRHLIQNIRDLVRTHVPQGGLVLVLSRGDEELLQLDPCRAAHFPQQDNGTYTGYHPLDGAAVIQDLEEIRQRSGAEFFLIPQTALWWLVEYRELADYLNEHATRIIDQHDVCIMYRFNH
jgi:2-polyprenyl-3-methyl-5-hydroxy-6-metoxy-1,4-benzoquinol methylase